MAAKAI